MTFVVPRNFYTPRAVERYETHPYQTKKSKDSPNQMVHAEVVPTLPKLFDYHSRSEKWGGIYNEAFALFSTMDPCGNVQKSSTTWPGTDQALYKLANKQNYTIPGTQMTSILNVNPSKQGRNSNQNKGHLGFRVYNYSYDSWNTEIIQKLF